MAKRARGSTSRPGQRAPLDRNATRRPGLAPDAPAAAPRPVALTQEEEDRAAELEAQIVAQERATEAASTRTRREAATASDVRARPGTLGTRTIEEYAYVSRDLRRIVLIGGSMLAFLIGLWVFTVATGVRPF